MLGDEFDKSWVERNDPYIHYGHLRLFSPWRQAWLEGLAIKAARAAREIPGNRDEVVPGASRSGWGRDW